MENETSPRTELLVGAILEKETPSRTQAIDRTAADHARTKIKTTFKGNGGLSDLSNDELLVLLADVTSEITVRGESDPQSWQRVPGSLRHVSRKILA